MTHAFVIRMTSTVLLTGLVVGLLAAAPTDGTHVAVGGGSPAREASVGAGASLPANDAPQVSPEHKWSKKPSSQITLPVHEKTGAAAWNGRLVVKFRDDLRMRADFGPGQTARTEDGRAMPQVDATLQAMSGTIRQAINRSVADLRSIEDRAKAYSGRTQPDLASMMYVDVPPGMLLATARAFNDMDAVEWVDIERIIYPDGGNQNASPQYGCGQNGAGDDTGATNCFTAGLAGRCSQIGGGPGCNNVGACGQDPVGAPCQFGCNNVTCCELVSDILPGCKDGDLGRGWDALCATYANILCDGNVYSGAPPTQGGMTAPVQLYRFDPCFAMRGPVDIAGPQFVVIQGTPIDLTAAGAAPPLVPLVASQLMTYTQAADGTVDPATLDFVVYPTNAPSDEGDAAVAVQAQPDPSLEGAYVALSAGCFSDHNFAGCSQTSCCVFVCRTDPTCCTVTWDATCVTKAQDASALPVNSPCTSQTLPAAVFVPAAIPSPLVTAGIDSTNRTRGYQAYMQGAAILGPGDVLPAGIGPSAFTIFAPTTRNDVDGLPARDDTTSNLGTLQFLVGGYRGGGYDLAGFELLATQVGVAAASVRGNGIKVAVIEHAAYVNHEDLVNRVTPEPNQTQVLFIEDPINPNHGTAVLGIIGAEKNAFGVTGIADQCGLRFYPIVSQQEGSRYLNAMTNAIIDLKEGDIINMSIGMGGGNTMPSTPPNYTLISTATDAGITSIISAGNDASPVKTVADGAPDDPPDSGAIIVGACWPGFQDGLLTTTATAPGPYPGNGYCRLNFSNFTDLDADRGGVVDCSAWGTAVTSTGYGDLFKGVEAPPPTDPLQIGKLRTYTALFNGTSSAAPMISGLAARVQSFSAAYFGAKLAPRTLRTALSSAVNQQCGIDYGNPAFPGYPEDGDPGAGDLIPIGQGGQLARIGGFPKPRAVLAYVVANTFGGAPVNADIITGNPQGGSNFSLRELDGVYLKIGSIRRRAGTSGQGYGPALLYPMTGGTTDVQVSLNSVQPVANVNAIAVVTASAITANIPAVQIIYLYNKVQNRWKSIGWVSLSPALNGGTFSPWGDPREYAIADSNGGTVIYARVYTCGLTAGAYTVFHDQVGLFVNVDLQNPGP